MIHCYENFEKTEYMEIRKAEKKDIPGILDLLIQVDMVHHNGRPDLFKGPATKYNERELNQIITMKLIYI